MRLRIADHVSERSQNRAKPLMKIPRGDTNYTGCNKRKPRPDGFNHTISSPIQTRVDAENTNQGGGHARIVPLVAVRKRAVSSIYVVAARKHWAELPCLGVGHLSADHCGTHNAGAK